MDSLHKDLGNCSFVWCPGNTVNVLCEQYLGDLNKLLDKHALLVTRMFTKQAAGCYLTPIGWQKPSDGNWSKSGGRKNRPTIEPVFVDRLLGVIHWSTKIRQITLETCSQKMLMTLRSYGRSYTLHCTQVLKQYSLLMNLRKVLLTSLPLISATK